MSRYGNTGEGGDGRSQQEACFGGKNWCCFQLFETKGKAETRQ